MGRSSRHPLVIAAAGVLLTVTAARAQSPVPSPGSPPFPLPETVAFTAAGPAPAPAPAAATQPAPMVPPGPGPEKPESALLPGLPHPSDGPRSLLDPARGPGYGCAPLPGPYFEHDPLLDPPNLPPPGWFVDGELAILKPVVIQHVTNSANPIPLTGDVFVLPTASLAWTVSPTFEVGYRLPSGFGEFALSYRFLVTEGNGTGIGMDGPASLKSRYDFNRADIDYVSREFSLWPCWEMQWRVGVRYVSFYWDSTATEPVGAALAGLAAGTSNGVFNQRASDSFVGVGPHATLELARHFGDKGLSFVVRTDAATMEGRIKQGFDETAVTGVAGTTTASRVQVSSSQDVPFFGLTVGLNWKAPTCRWLEVFAGYEGEYWWNVGRYSSTPDSRGEVYDQGVMLRTQLTF